MSSRLTSEHPRAIQGFAGFCDGCDTSTSA